MQPGGGAIFSSSSAAANTNAIGSVAGVPVGDLRAIVAVEQPACASARATKGRAQPDARASALQPQRRSWLAAPEVPVLVRRAWRLGRSA